MTLADFRDWAIVILAAFVLVQTLLVIILVAVLIRLSLSLKTKAEPIFDMTRQTLGDVSGTTRFIADRVVKPVIGTVGFLVGARKMVGWLVGFRGRKGGKKR